MGIALMLPIHLRCGGGTAGNVSNELLVGPRLTSLVISMMNDGLARAMWVANCRIPALVGGFERR